MRHRIRAAAVVTVALAALTASAQDIQNTPSGNDQPVDPTLTFEVASVRPNELGSQSQLSEFRSGRFTSRYVTLELLIRSATGSRSYR